MFETYDLDNVGMVIDADIVKPVRDHLDHKHLNDLMKGNPTAENIAKLIYMTLTETVFRLCHEDGEDIPVRVVSVKVYETATCWAEFFEEVVG